MDLLQRFKSRVGMIVGFFVGAFIARLIDGGSIYSAILWGAGYSIIAIILTILGVDKLIKNKISKKRN